MIFSILFSLCKNHDTILQKLKKMEEEFEDTKEVIRICIIKEEHNGQKKEYKKTNNDQQNIHIKLKIE
jgi:ribosomal protein S6